MNKELKKLEELLANDRKIIEENYKEIERLNNIIKEAIEYVEESYSETVDGIEGIAKFFSKREEILLKILKRSESNEGVRTI